MKDRLSGRVLAAARVLVGISRADLARAAGLDADQIRLLEAGGSALVPPADAERLQPALEDFGAIFLAESDGMGAGVRLKFTRQDVRQLTRLEGEGGLIGSDDVP